MNSVSDVGPPEYDTRRLYERRSAIPLQFSYEHAPMLQRSSHPFFTPPPQMVYQGLCPREKPHPRDRPHPRDSLHPRDATLSRSYIDLPASRHPVHKQFTDEEAYEYHSIDGEFLHPGKVLWADQRRMGYKRDRPQFLTPQPQMVRSYRSFPMQRPVSYTPEENHSYLVQRSSQEHPAGSRSQQVQGQSYMLSFDVSDPQYTDDLDDDTNISSVSQRISKKKRKLNRYNGKQRVESDRPSDLDISDVSQNDHSRGEIHGTGQNGQHSYLSAQSENLMHGQESPLIEENGQCNAGNETFNDTAPDGVLLHQSLNPNRSHGESGVWDRRLDESGPTDHRYYHTVPNKSFNSIGSDGQFYTRMEREYERMNETDLSESFAPGDENLRLREGRLVERRQLALARDDYRYASPRTMLRITSSSVPCSQLSQTINGHSCTSVHSQPLTVENVEKHQSMMDISHSDMDYDSNTTGSRGMVSDEVDGLLVHPKILYDAGKENERLGLERPQNRGNLSCHNPDISRSDIDMNSGRVLGVKQSENLNSGLPKIPGKVVKKTPVGTKEKVIADVSRPNAEKYVDEMIVDSSETSRNICDTTSRETASEKAGALTRRVSNPQSNKENEAMDVTDSTQGSKPQILRANQKIDEVQTNRESERQEVVNPGTSTPPEESDKYGVHGLLADFDVRNNGANNSELAERDDLTAIQSIHDYHGDEDMSSEDDMEELTLLTEVQLGRTEVNVPGQTEKIVLMETSTEKTIDQNDSTEELSPLPLYYWIIKTVPEVKGVMVEGQKSEDDEVYWETGLVKRRISNTVVENHSGHRYQLIGDIDLEDAILGGFDWRTIEKFTKGFPKNWTKVISNFYSTSSNTSKGKGSSESQNSNKESTCMLREKDQSKGQSERSRQGEKSKQEEKPRQGEKSKKEEKSKRNKKSSQGEKSKQNENSKQGETSKQEEKSMQEEKSKKESSKQEGRDAEKSKGTSTKQTKSKKEALDEIKGIKNKNKRKEEKDGTGKIYTLTKWRIIPQEWCQGVCVEGKIKHDEEGEVFSPWHSSPIHERVNSRTLKSSWGSVYKLEGHIQKLWALEAGFPSAVVKAFKRGFPPNWQDIIAQYFAGETKVQGKTDKVKPQGRNEDLRPLTGNEQVFTPIGQRIQLDSVQRTRSGRAVKPRVGWWMGQKLEVDESSGTFKLEHRTEYSLKIASKMSMQFASIKPKNLNQSVSSRKGNVTVNTLCDNSVGRVSGNTHSFYLGLNAAENKTDQKSCTQVMNESQPQIDKQKTMSQHQNNTSSARKAESENGSQGSKEKTSEKNVYELSSSDEDKKKSSKKTRRKASRKNDKINKVLHNNEEERGRVPRRPPRNVSKVVSYKEETLSSEREEESMKSRQRGRPSHNSKQRSSKDHRPMRRKSDDRRGTEESSIDENSAQESDTETSVIVVTDTVKKRVTRSTVNKKKQTTESNHRKGSEKALLRTDNSTGNVGKRGSRKNNIVKKEGEGSKSQDKSQAKTDKWRSDEVIRFTKMLKILSPDEAGFWEMMSDGVKTRTVEECQEYYYRDVPEHQKKLTERKTRAKTGKAAENSSAPELTAKVGTLKRKQQLREIIENVNEGHSDDVFDSTPYRKYNGAKMPRLEEEEEEEEDVFAELAAKNEHFRKRIFTPLTRLEIRPASTSKTPASQLQIDTPVYDRKKIDQYTRQAQLKRRRLVHQTRRLKTPLNKKKVTSTQKKKKNPSGKKSYDVGSLFVAECDSDDNHNNSSEEEDFYFSDHD